MPVAVLLSQSLDSLETGTAATSDCQTQIRPITVGFHSERMTLEVLGELHSPATPKPYGGLPQQEIVDRHTHTGTRAYTRVES